MKKTCYLLMALLLGLAAKHSLAQDCATGFCPETITVHHKAGDVSPIDADITYEVGQVNIGTSGDQCWILQNLGASRAATNYTDINNETRGWYWQWGNKQGYGFSTTNTITPEWGAGFTSAVTWGDDPCTILLGDSWSIPKRIDINQLTDWNTSISGLYSGYGLNLITNGYIENGTFYYVGSYMRMWTEDGPNTTGYSTRAYSYYYNGSSVGNEDTQVRHGYGIRCVMIL